MKRGCAGSNIQPPNLCGIAEAIIYQPVLSLSARPGADRRELSFAGPFYGKFYYFTKGK